MSEKKNYPFFTVIIPNYNRADLIMETLESVFQQTYPHYEILLIDNGSTDNSLALLKPLADTGKIQLISIPENIERARARNIGFENAKGDYLTLLDSDDFMYPDNLLDAANFISRNGGDFFHNQYELVDEDRKVLNTYRFPSEPKQLKRLAMGNFISCIGVFLSKAVYSTYRFNEDEKILGSEDWELWIRIRSKFPLGAIPKVNNGVRFHSGRSISSYQLEAIVERKNYIIDQLLAQPDVKKVFGKYENDMRAAALVFAATSANEMKAFDEAKKYLAKALKLKTSLILDPHFIRVAQITGFKIKKKYL